MHLFDHPVHGKKRRWRIRSFSDLPPDVHQQLCELGRIAYEGILHKQQVIFSDLPEDFETLGLMHCSPELFVDEGVAVSYNFLHLTIQEYLAQRRRRHFKSGQATATKRSLMHVNGGGGVYNRQVVQPRSKPTWLKRPVHNVLLSKRS